MHFFQNDILPIRSRHFQNPRDIRILRTGVRPIRFRIARLQADFKTARGSWLSVRAARLNDLEKFSRPLLTPSLNAALPPRAWKMSRRAPA
jgi:hypothetical protein